MSKEIQAQIDKLSDEDKAKLSDGYHTFEDLYEHRHRLLIALLESQDILDGERGCRLSSPWKSKKHSDGSEME